MDIKGYTVSAYAYSFPLSSILPPPEMAPFEKLVSWNTLSVQFLHALAWLNLHRHGLEYSELLHKNIMEEFK